MAEGILTKGITLYYSNTAATTPSTSVKSHWNWSGKSEVTSMFSFPDLKGSRDAVDVTTLAHDSYQYIQGIKNNGNILSFELIYEGNASGDNFYALSALETAGNAVGFGLQFPNSGAIFMFEGFVNVVIQGGGVNEAIKCTLEVTLSSDIEVEASFS